MAFNPNQTFDRFEIGYVIVDGKKEEYWTNIAISHMNGNMRNEKLLKMTDYELNKLVFLDENTVLTEEYIRPDNVDIANQQAGKKGEIYDAPHRGVVILQYREARKTKNISPEQMTDNRKALEKLKQDLQRKQIIKRNICVK